MLCDELVSALEGSIQSHILNLLIRPQRRLSLSYLFFAHNLLVVRNIQDCVVMIYLDVFVEEGIAEEIFANTGHAYTGSLLSPIPVPDQTLRVKPKRTILEDDVHSPLHLLRNFY